VRGALDETLDDTAEYEPGGATHYKTAAPPLWGLSPDTPIGAPFWGALEPGQHLANLGFICEGVAIDDANFSWTGKRNDAAVLEPGQGAAHGLDRKRQVIGNA